MKPLSLWQFIFAVATSALAISIGTFVFQWVWNWRMNRRSRKVLMVQLAIELEQVQKLLDRLKVEYKARKYYPINFLNLGKNVLVRIENSISSSALLGVDLQRVLYEVSTDCRTWLEEINGAESWLVESGLSDSEKNNRSKIVNEQRKDGSIELLDTQNRLTDLIRDLKK